MYGKQEVLKWRWIETTTDCSSISHALTSKKASKCQVATQAKCSPSSPWDMWASVWASQGTTRMTVRLSCGHRCTHARVYVHRKALELCLRQWQRDSLGEVERTGEVLYGLTLRARRKQTMQLLNKTCHAEHNSTGSSCPDGQHRAEATHSKGTWVKRSREGGGAVVWRKWDREEVTAWWHASPMLCAEKPAQTHKFFQCFLVRLCPRRETVGGFYWQRSYSSMSVVCPSRCRASPWWPEHSHCGAPGGKYLETT